MVCPLQDDFMTMGYLPPRLPVSCLSMAPRFDTKTNASVLVRRNPLTEVNSQNQQLPEVGFLIVFNAVKIVLNSPA